MTAFAGVEAMAEDAVRELAPRAQAKNLEPVLYCDGGLPLLSEEPSRHVGLLMASLLQQACANALPGELTFSVAVEAQGAQTLLHLSVCAVGGEAPKRFAGEGIVKALGGTHGAETLPGRGFALWSRVPIEPQGHEPAEHPHLKGKRFLVVDKGPAQREAIRRRLWAWGATVTLSEEVPAAGAYDGVLRDLPKPLARQTLFEAAKASLLAPAPTAAAVPATVAAARPAPVLLICDDDKLARELLSTVLTESGFTVAQAENGQEGLEAIRQRRPSVVLLDIDMPVKTGVDVLRELRQSPPPNGAPDIIIISNHESEKIQSLCKSLGARETMTKPYEFTELIDRLKTMLAAGPAQ